MKKAFLLCIFLFLYAGIQAQDRTDSMHVAHYDVHLNITDFSNRVIYGYTDVRMVSKVENLDHLDLDLKNMVVDSVWVNGSGTSNYVHSGELLRILLTDAINQDDTVNIRVYYGGVPSGDSDLGGFYFRGEYCYNLGVSMRCVPHSYGRVWFPCMDFFTDKSTYQFSIETEANKRAICGGELRDSVVTDSNTIIWNWSLDLPVPVYLVSVAVGEYAHYADTVQGMERVLPIDIYSVPSHYADIEPTFGHLKDVIHLYESLYGPYPWNRVGYVGVDFNMGAMEHVTNIAYPNFAFSGPYYESLYIHEFSHMWFGDLITCNRAEEMWINEGFARYNEAVADEYLYPSDDPAVDGYKTKIRGLHRGVLADAHVDDNGYWALDSMPLNVTYGTTTYDKGAVVVHTLRKYMGDSLFFSSLRDLFTTFAFQNISSEQLFEFLEERSGVPLHDFYEGWVHQPGFLHFSVDSIRLTGEENNYRFYVRQKLSHARSFANSNKIDITFISNDRQQYTLEGFTFDGEFGMGTVTLPFQPLLAVVDMDEKLADAIVDHTMTLTQTGLQNISAVNVKLLVDAISDTTFFRIEDNYVAADPLRTENDNITAVSDGHYWRVAMSPENAIQGGLRFTYRAGNATALDYSLLNGHTTDELVLLYRHDPSEDWRIINFTQSGTISSGALVTEMVANGEYAIGLGNGEVGVNESPAPAKYSIYPNPASDHLNIHIAENVTKSDRVCRIYDANGKLVLKSKLTCDDSSLNISRLKSGVYVVCILENNQVVASQKVVKQ